MAHVAPLGFLAAVALAKRLFASAPWRPKGHPEGLSHHPSADGEPRTAAAVKVSETNGGKYAASDGGGLDVLIVGGSAAGLSTAACLDAIGVTNYLVIERNESVGDLWRSRYHRLHLHDIIDECQLPFFEMPSTFPTYVPRLDFANYLDSYRQTLGLSVLTRNEVTKIEPDGPDGWLVTIRNLTTGTTWSTRAKRVVVANGVYGSPRIPVVQGSDRFAGPQIHTANFKNGSAHGLENKRVLIVGYGNSGSEIALDLLEHKVSRLTMIVRSPISVVPRSFVEVLQKALHRGRFLLHIPFFILLLPILGLLVDCSALFISRLTFGFSLRKHGLRLRWALPFLSMLRELSPPNMDVGTISMVKKGRIVIEKSEIAEMRPDSVILRNGREIQCDAIIWATGYEFLSGHESFLGSDLAQTIVGKDAIRSRSIGLDGSVASSKTLWLCFGRLQMINRMARRVAVSVARSLKLAPRRDIVGDVLIRVLKMNAVAATVLAAGWWYKIQAATLVFYLAIVGVVMA